MCLGKFSISNRNSKVQMLENMLGLTKNAGHTGRYEFFLYIVGLKRPVFEGMDSDE